MDILTFTATLDSQDDYQAVPVSALDAASCKEVFPTKPDVSSITNRLESMPVIHDPVLVNGQMSFTDQVRLGFADPISGFWDSERFATFTTIPVAKPKKYSVQYRLKPQSDAKTFLERRERGEIVLNPLTAVDVEIDDRLVVFQANSYSRLRTSSSRRQVEVQRGPGVCNKIDTTILPVYPGLIALRYPPNGSYNLTVNGIEMARYKGAVARNALSNGFPLDQLMAELVKLEPSNNLRNNTLGDLHDSVYDLMTEMAEAKETISYLYGILRRLLLMAVGVKSREAAARKKFKGKELIDEITSLWMQFRYAASPLGYSANDILEYLGTSQRAFATARGREDVDLEFEVPVNGGIMKIKTTVELRLFAKASVSGPFDGLGMNPAKALWEVSPYTFVIGWVLPISQWLSAIGKPPGMGARQTMVSKRIRSMDITFTTPLQSVKLSNKCNIYIAKPVDVSATWPMPDVYLDWKRGLDAMSLGWSLFLKQHWKS